LTYKSIIIDMMNAEPRWRRRKTARPGEIIAAALDVFAENGFAGAKLDEVARRAGVSKGALYVYFETKEELFRAVVRTAIAPNLERVRATAETLDAPFALVVPMLLANGTALMSETRLPAVVKMVIGESRNFPDLARIWHDDVAAPIVDVVIGLIARAQAKGEIAPGDPLLYALSILGPLLMGMLFRETFGEVTAELPDLNQLAAQHARTVLHGLLVHPGNGGKA
jgi:AcrR family transcriptional regulator